MPYQAFRKPIASQALPVRDDDRRGVVRIRSHLDGDGCTSVADTGAEGASVEVFQDRIRETACDYKQPVVRRILVFAETQPRCRWSCHRPWLQ